MKPSEALKPPSEVKGYEGEAAAAASESMGLDSLVQAWFNEKKSKTKLELDMLTVTDPTKSKIKRFAPEASRWTIVDAIGDGHCLLHAIFDSVSSTYRKLKKSDKRLFIIHFRYSILAEKMNETDFYANLSEERQQEVFDRITSDVPEYLTIDEIIIIAELYKVNVFVLNYDGRQKLESRVQYQVVPTELINEEGEWNENGHPWILLYNSVENGIAHFEAIRIDSNYIFSFEQLSPILKKYVVRKNVIAACDFTAGDEFWMVGDNYEEEAGYLIIQTILEDVTRICKSLKYISKSAIEEADRDDLELEDEQYVNINDTVVWELGDEDTKYLLAEKWNVTNDTIKIFNKDAIASVSVSNVVIKKDGNIILPESTEGAEAEAEEEGEEAANEANYTFSDDKLRRLKEPVEKERTEDKYEIKSSTYVPTTRRAFSDFIETTFSTLKLPPLKAPDFNACLKKGASGQQEVEVYQYQKFIREYMNSDSPYRGILVYHGLGSGKTCSAIAASEALYAKNQQRKIIIMTPKSLQKNFIRELTFCGFRHYRIENHWVGIDWTPETNMFAVNVIGLPGKYIQEKKPAKLWVPDFDKESNFQSLKPSDQTDVRRQILATINNNVRFISYNGVTTKTLIDIAKNKAFDNAVIIVDEIHNLIRLMQGNLDYFLKQGIGAWAAARKAEPVTTDRWKLLNADGDKKKYSRGYLFYRLLTDAQNSRIIGLSGTPLINFPEELGILANVLHKYINSASTSFRSQNMIEDKKLIKKVADEHPYIDDVRFTEGSGNLTVLVTGLPEGTKKKFEGATFKGIAREDKVVPFQTIIDSFKETLSKKGRKVEFKLTALPLLPVFHEEFMDAFIDQESGTLKLGGPDIVLGKRLTGLISYYKGSKVELMPSIKSDTLEFVEMSDFQATAYMEVRNKEVEKELKQKKKDKGKAAPWLNEAQQLEKSTTYKMVSRQTCNFAFLEEIVRPRPKKFGKLEEAIEGLDKANKDIGDADESVGQKGDELLVGEEEDAGNEAEADEEDQVAKKQQTEDVEGAADAPDAPVVPVKEQVIEKEYLEKYQAVIKIQKEIEATGKVFKPTPEQSRILNVYRCRLGNTDKGYQKDCERVRACLRYFGKDPPPSKNGIRYGKLSLKGDLAKYSAKFARMLERMEESPGSNLVYSQFLSMEGIGIFSICMEINGYVPIEISYNADTKLAQFNESSLKSLQKGPKGGVKRYIKFTGGEADDVRRMNLALFNGRFSDLPATLQEPLIEYKWTADDPETKSLILKGALCNVFCITSAGAEGISLRNVRRVHIMEPYWNDVRIAQVKGRAIRICSHIDFPDVADRSVEIFTYLSCFSKKIQIAKEVDKEKIDETIKMKDGILIDEAVGAGIRKDEIGGFDGYTTTSDEQLYLVSFKKRIIISKMEEIMKSASIDCQLNETENDDVNLCLAIPDGKIGDYLYHPVLEQDLIYGGKDLKFIERAAPAAASLQASKPTVRKFTVEGHGDFEARPVIKENILTGYDLFRENKRVGIAGVNDKGLPAKPIKLAKGV